jgi:hypothetical protein
VSEWLLFNANSTIFLRKHAALRRKSKDWLARNQDNVSKWGDIHVCLSRTVVSKNLIIISLKKVYRNDRDKSRGGGVLIAVRKTLISSEIFKSNDTELLAVKSTIIIDHVNRSRSSTFLFLTL